MSNLRAISPLRPTGYGLACNLSGGFSLQIDHLEQWLLRIAITPEEGLEVDRTWMIAPDGDVPWNGRNRLSLEGFSTPSPTHQDDGLSGKIFSVAIEAEPLGLTIRQRVNGEWTTLFQDRPGGAYQWFEKYHRFKHFQLLRGDEAHYGLGDKAGPLDRSHRRVRCLQVDALGYDAEQSDPLYKHAPFVMPTSGGSSFGLLYDTMAETAFDLGAEHSNYFDRYRHVEASEKALIYYVIAGPQLNDVVPRLTRLTGGVAFQPRWSMGFAFTSMHHADADKAQTTITGFADEVRDRGIPISAIHLGSGYTAGSDGKRYVFNWNTSRFPDRDGFFNALREMGFRTCANVKPVLLTGHDAFHRASREGWFVRRADGSPAIEMFWGGEGASLDFTNQGAAEWWKNGISSQVIGAGFDAVWNDNNEAELADENATIDGFGNSLPAMDARPVHALLMTRASREAMIAQSPQERPYSITRAGPIGISRYAETWTGDNATSWKTLKWNLRQGLSMSLSAMPLTGHDIGGFVGPRPGPELLVRWFQMMALHPRCVMNSWKPEHGNVPNLPWMHEEVTGLITDALSLRYRFLPLIYALAYQTHTIGHPIIAPPYYWYDDTALAVDHDVFMLGPDVLVAPVVTEGARQVEIALPVSRWGWFCYHSGTIYEGGKTIVIDAPMERLPLFVRCGALLPLANDVPETSPHDPSSIEITLFAPAERGQSETEIFFDDGLGWGYKEGDASLLKCSAQWDAAEVHFSLSEIWTGKGRPEIFATDRLGRPCQLDTDW